MCNMVTNICVHDHKANDVGTSNLKPFETNWKETEAYKKFTNGQMLATSLFDAQAVYACKYENGLVGGLLSAYNHHHNIILRPDDFWMAIMTQFSFYVHLRSLKLKDKFVDFDGKKKLEIHTSGNTKEANYAELILQFGDLIEKNIIDNTLRHWIIPHFTTTTKEDKIVFGVALMGIMQSYFDYKIHFECGIPNVTLLGSLDDYKLLAIHIEYLINFNLEDNYVKVWVSMLRCICQNLIESVQHQNAEFWRHVCKIEGGSGSTEITGWLSAFCVFDSTGNWQGQNLAFCKELNTEFPLIDTQDIPPGFVLVPLEINDNGASIITNLMAGSLMLNVIEKCTFQPRIDFCLAIVEENKIGFAKLSREKFLEKQLLEEKKRSHICESHTECEELIVPCGTNLFKTSDCDY